MPGLDSGMRRNSLIAGAGALCSRVLGFARDAALAWLLGASATADALSVALRLPYLIRRLYGEGAFSLELAVRCVRARHAGPPGNGDDIALGLAVGGHVLRWGLGLFLAGLAAAGPVLFLLAPGLGDRPDVLAEATALFRLCLPYIPAAMLAAVSMAVLHGRENFAVPALTPALFNITVLAFVAAAACGIGEPGLTVAAGVACGGCVQYAVQRPSIRRLAREFPSSSASPVTAGNARRVAAELPFGLLGAAAPQLVFFVAAALTSLAPDSSLAALFYAERLLEFPQGLIVASIGVACAPELARRAAAGGRDAIAAPLGRALELSLLCAVPAAAGLMAVSLPLVAALFGHGAFDDEAVRVTALFLCAYAPGLPAYAVSRPLLAACHALEDRSTPVRAVCVGLGTALCVGWGGMYAWGIAGPPLGASIGLWAYAGALWSGVRGAGARSGSLPAFPWRRLLLSVCGGVLVWLAASQVAAGLSPFAALSLAIPCGVSVYGLWLFGVDAGLRRDARNLFRGLYSRGGEE